MKKQIRRGVFETNSSSTHSLTWCTKTDYEKWENGEYTYDWYNDKLIPVTDEIKESMNRYLTCEQYEGHCENYDTFYDTYTASNGEEIVAFGYYGYNG